MKQTVIDKIVIIALYFLAIAASAAVQAAPGEVAPNFPTRAFTQQSRLVSKGTATNSQGIKFSDWEMILVAGEPLKTTRPIRVRQAHSYYFKARKGQNFSAEIDSVEPTAVFALYAPDGTRLGETDAEGTGWMGALETDGEYKIVVSTDRKANYSLTAEID